MTFALGQNESQQKSLSTITNRCVTLSPLVDNEFKMTEDKVWWSNERKLQGLCDEISSAIAWHGNVLALAHFENTRSSLEAALRARSIEYQTYSSFDSSALCASSTGETGKVWLGLARSLQPPPMLASKESAAAFVAVLVAEHHPLRSRDEQLLRAASNITCGTEVSYHIALDDPLIVHFSGDSVQRLFKQLGASEVDSLSNPLITRAIQQAQRKIESQLPRDLPAQSIDDWFKHNLPAKRT
jgi:preprotein translocase subunit SecA